MTNKTWQEEKIKHTAEHIGIISEGALKTLVSEIRQQDMEELIKSTIEYIRKNLRAGESYDRGSIYINIDNNETVGSGSFDWDNEFWDQLEDDIINKLKQ